MHDAIKDKLEDKKIENINLLTHHDDIIILAVHHLLVFIKYQSKALL